MAVRAGVAPHLRPRRPHHLQDGRPVARRGRPAARGWALAPIVASHYLIDRYRLARHVNWLANFIAPIEKLTWWERRYLRVPPGRRPEEHLWQPPDDEEAADVRWRSSNPPWSECSTYGSPPGVPDHVAFVVMIAVDQIMHLLCNWVALRWLG